MNYPNKLNLMLPLLLLLCVDFVQGQYTPQPGSAERKAIMDALRVPIKRQLKKPVIFQVGNLRVKDGWAVISATPLRPDGGKFDWTDTKYAKCIKEGDCDNGVQALLKRSGDTWSVVEYAIGSTDWGMGNACKKHNCPIELQQ